MSQNPRKAASRPQEGAGFNEFSDADREAARRLLRVGFAAAQLLVENRPICPACGENRRGKVKLKEDATNPYWKCFRCGAFADVFHAMELRGIKFVDAMRILLGRGGSIDPRALRAIADSVEAAVSFVATVDVEVYNLVHQRSDLAAAQRYYASWHISADAVAEAGSRVVLDPKGLERELLELFGRDRLLESGVMMIDKNGKDLFLFSADYPVIEPHLSPNGHVVGMQFRPSPRQLAKVQAHKAWKKRWGGHVDNDGNTVEAKEAWKAAYVADADAAGEYAPYIAPFMSIRGAGPDSLVGCGIARIAALPAGSKVYVVEGFKDLMAARTLGVEAYAIPGTGVMPSAKVCQLLVRHQMLVMLDGDEAGAKGRAALLEHFATMKVPAVERPDLRPGMDVADILVERNAHTGCDCATCMAWRDDHPYDWQDCPCHSCKLRRTRMSG